MKNAIRKNFEISEDLNGKLEAASEIYRKSQTDIVIDALEHSLSHRYNFKEKECESPIVQSFFSYVKTQRPSLAALLECRIIGRIFFETKTLEVEFSQGHFAARQLSEAILRKEISDFAERFFQGAITDFISTTRPMMVIKEILKSDHDLLKAAKVLGGKVDSVTITSAKF